MSNLNTPAAEWLADQFEFEFCEECSGDACHHTAVLLLGNWFARCDYPPADDGTPHPVIAAYRATGDGRRMTRQASAPLTFLALAAFVVACALILP